MAHILSRFLGSPIVYEPASALGYFRHLEHQGLVTPHDLVQTLLHCGSAAG